MTGRLGAAPDTEPVMSIAARRRAIGAEALRAVGITAAGVPVLAATVAGRLGVGKGCDTTAVRVVGRGVTEPVYSGAGERAGDMIGVGR